MARTYAPLEGGIQKLVAALSSSRDDELAGQFRNNSRMAQARKYNSEADINEARLANMTSGRTDLIAGKTGLMDPQVAALVDIFKTGNMPEVPAAGPPTAEGVDPTIMQKPEWLTPEVEQGYNQARQVMGMNDIAPGKTKANDLAEAMQQIVNMGRQNEMIAGEVDPNVVAAAMGANAGKPTVDVTASGIGFNPYGDKNDLNTGAFLKRFGGAGKLPAEAKMIQFYQGIGYPKEQAVELARSKKNLSIRELATETYLNLKENIDFNNSTLPEEERKALAEQKTIEAMQFIQKTEKQFGGGKEKPPTEGAKKAPDGNWYVPDPQRPGKYLQVTP